MSTHVKTSQVGKVPPTLRWEAVRGHTFSKTVRFKDITGAPLEISGSTFAFQVRKSKYQNTGDPLIECTLFTFGQSAEALAEGVTYDEITLTLSAEDMDVTPGIWDLGLTQVVGDVRRALLQGRFKINEDVVRGS